MKSLIPAAIALCLPLSVSAGPASDDDDSGCVKFSEQRETVYHGGEHLLVRDQGQHFRVSFVGRQCGEIPAAAKLRLHSGGEKDVLCAGKGKVSARTGSCRVAEVEPIDADTFAQQSRRRR